MKGFLPVTNLFFWGFCYSLRTSYKGLIWCTKNQIPIFILFVSTGVLFDGDFSVWVSLKIVFYDSVIKNGYTDFSV